MFVMVDVQIHNIKENKVKTETVRYEQRSEISG